MTLFTLKKLSEALEVVRTLVPETPSYRWPLLCARSGVDVIVKHENHTPTGSFKARGGLVYIDGLRRSGNLPTGLVTATRGNHGQSIAIGAARNNLPALIVVPEGNSQEKNASMVAFGGEVLVKGKDFDECRAVAARLQEERNYLFVPSFHRDLVLGVATYAYELFSKFSALDVIYVPIGMGSGICGLITVRDLLGLRTEIVGVVAENAPAFALSLDAGHTISTKEANTFADGMACREPQEEPFEIIRQGAARVVKVSEFDIAEAIRTLYTDTHNLAEGAGAASLAALMKEKERYAGKQAAVILCGGNIDLPVFSKVLAGETPVVS